MAITTLDGFIASAKQTVLAIRTAARVSVATSWFSLMGLAGNPGVGVLAGANTANGVVPNDATAGAPIITNFGGLLGYITNIDFSSTVAGRIMLVDMLFKAGAYAFNSNVTLTAQPSYLARAPNNGAGLRLWFEAVTAFTGNPTITVTYTNQSATGSRSTGAIALGLAPTIGRMIELPLQAGDSGIQRIDSVVCTVATVGTFNILVLRPLWSGRVRVVNDGDSLGLDVVGMPTVYEDSCLQVLVNADGVSTGLPELQIEIAVG